MMIAESEYKKLVTKRLADISEQLIAEYDPESPKYWFHDDTIKEITLDLHSVIEPQKDNILEFKEIFPELIMSQKEAYLSRMAILIQSDPFIPRTLRGSLLDFYQTRLEVMRAVHHDVFNAYCTGLKNGKYWDTLESNHHWLHNETLYLLTERGHNISQIEEKVHGLRDSIQNYFEEFNS